MPVDEHKNVARAPLKPLNLPTLALSVGGLGFLRPAPGTWGSIPPVAIVAAMAVLGTSTPVMHSVAGALLVLASVACVAWGDYAERRFGRKDASEVVADEAAGVCLPVVAALSVVSDTSDRLWALLAAFLLFRLFDIAKPWPVSRLERLPGGWGVLLDDLMAGVYAALVVIGGARLLL